MGLVLRMACSYFALRPLGCKCMGFDSCSFFLRRLYYQIYSMDFLEEIAEQSGSQNNGMGGCHHFCIGSCVFHQHIFLSKLSDSFVFARKIVACGRFSGSKQTELRTTRTHDATVISSGATHHARYRWKIVSRKTPMALS